MHATQRLDYSVGETALVAPNQSHFCARGTKQSPSPSLAWRWRQHIAASLEPPLLQRTVCVSCPAFPCNWMDNHMPSYIQFPVLGRQACMVPPKARRLPGPSWLQSREMFHGSGRKAAREADPPIVSDWRGESEQRHWAYVPFSSVLFEPCVMCFCDAASSTHSEKEALVWTLDHLVSPLSLSSTPCFFYHWNHGGEIQLVSKLGPVRYTSRYIKFSEVGGADHYVFQKLVELEL